MTTHFSYIGLDRLRVFLRSLIGPERRFATAKEMADELGLAGNRKSVLYKFLGGTEPRAGAVLDWLDKLGVPVQYDGVASGCDVEFVPVLAGKTGAGEYIPAPGDENFSSFRAVDKSFASRLGFPLGQCCFLDVVGDSMEPLFSSGTTLLVDFSENARLYPVDGKIYVVRHRDAILVKRLHITPEAIYLRSENPMHRPIVVLSEEMDGFAVLGRVRWYSVVA